MALQRPSECVVAVYGSGTAAQQGVEALLSEGFDRADISLVARSLKNVPDEVHKALKHGDAMERDGTLGAGIGALVGALGGGTAVAAAGIGVLVVAGPLVALTGAIVGGLVGSIAGWGIHRDSAAEYEKLVEQGKVLVIAHGNNPRGLAEAQHVLQATKPESLSQFSKIDDADDPRVAQQ